MALTAKQQRFVEEYLIDLNATQAAIRAGYSENTAQEQGSRLLSNVMVKEAIENRQEKIQEKTQVTQEWVIQQYMDIIKNCKEVEPNTAKGALDSVAKHLGMFKDKLEITGSLTIENVLEKI
ncbi:terminase small subunit [Cohnella nanjingensis]|uniref:Terminase small subunit n=1 Tax=Cohnella nanjingensis TaxID=1387779 RepID=A0A7X0RUF5_9BACL|nr:terminase small subunit [Cohnella nanjingensis]MBB6672615.1 terminase small subunit [Cohnella nanjingensis]